MYRLKIASSLGILLTLLLAGAADAGILQFKLSAILQTDATQSLTLAPPLSAFQKIRITSKDLLRQIYIPTDSYPPIASPPYDWGVITGDYGYGSNACVRIAQTQTGSGGYWGPYKSLEYRLQNSALFRDASSVILYVGPGNEVLCQIKASHLSIRAESNAVIEETNQSTQNDVDRYLARSRFLALIDFNTDTANRWTLTGLALERVSGNHQSGDYTYSWEMRAAGAGTLAGAETVFVGTVRERGANNWFYPALNPALTNWYGDVDLLPDVPDANVGMPLGETGAPFWAPRPSPPASPTTYSSSGSGSVLTVWARLPWMQPAM